MLRAFICLLTLSLTFAELQRVSLTRNEPSEAEKVAFIANLKRHQMMASVGAPVPVPLQSNMFSYYLQAVIGGQQFYLLPDTGSSNTWVPSSKCQVQSCVNHNRYYSGASKTYTPNGKLFQVPYGSGTVNGYLSNDDVTIGGITVTQHTFGEVTYEQGDAFLHSNFDGLLGLAFQSIANDNVMPWIPQARVQNRIEHASFSFNLKPTGGWMVIGGVDQRLYTGNVFWTPLLQQSYWVFRGDAVLVGGVAQFCQNGCPVILDTGTSLIALPTDMYNALSKWIVVDQYCRNLPHLPNVSFTINGNLFTLGPNDYVIKVTQYGQQQCMSGFSAFDNSQGMIILGDVFLRKFYSIYDMQNSRIGLALAI
eukprot:TRINITY_DN2807_c2_g2_i1.p1 TRINITY_DN2807_c2_g2~~TRINITY_DN2807_c2_g2_i1.p1  ORF type:complete len:365 (-),score=87.01 TRINITY_DN2807_c2_g2_i1:27-1121(-)